MPGPASYTIPPEHHGDRVDVALSKLAGCSVQAIKRLCGLKRVMRGAQALRKGDHVRTGDVVVLEEPPVEDSAPPRLELAWESPRYLVVDKPAGMASHRLRSEDPPSALEAVAVHDPRVITAGPDPREGGLLHRLDVATSGALAFARDAEAFEAGRAAFKNGTARKLYLALVHGGLPPTGAVTLPVAHDTADPRRSVVVHPGQKHRGDPREATTRWRVLLARGPDALVIVDAEGGRRHQVRVHMAFAGAPLWGDDLYGGPPWPAQDLPGHALHAVYLRFPSAEGVVETTVGAPAPFAAAARRLLGDDVNDVLARTKERSDAVFAGRAG